MNQDQLQRLACGMLATAWDILSADGELVPVFAVVHRDGGIDLVGAPWTDDTEKSVMLGMLADRISDVGDVVALCQVADAYVGDAKGGRPSENPAATEAIIAYAKDDEGHTFLAYQAYGRADDGTLVKVDAQPEVTVTTIPAGDVARLFATIGASESERTENEP